MQKILKFGFTGILCFFIDYGLMIFFTEVLDIYYLISSALAFSIAVIVNYILSIRFVFDVKDKHHKLVQFAFFVILSVIGLGLNQIFMWIFVKTGIHYMLAKIITNGLVMVYNYITRKRFLEYE